MDSILCLVVLGSAFILTHNYVVIFIIGSSLSAVNIFHVFIVLRVVYFSCPLIIILH